MRTGQAADYWHLVHLHVIAPEQPLDVAVLTFDEREAERLWDCGYDDARAFLQGLHEDQEALEHFGEPAEGDLDHDEEWARDA